MVEPADERPLIVLAAAAYPAVRAGLISLLANGTGLSPVPFTGVSGDRFDETAPDVIVVELSGDSEAMLEDLELRFRGAPMVLLGSEPRASGPGVGAGPVAYLPSTVDGPALIASVRAVSAGLVVLAPEYAGAMFQAHPLSPMAIGLPGETLTPREREVLELVASGLPNKAIARELGITEHTVKFHVGSVLDKLGAGSRTEAVTIATRRGILIV